MRLHVQRCDELVPGRVSWVEGLNELLFVVSGRSVSAEGAASLAGVWQAFVDAGVWQWGPQRPGALEVSSSVYRLADLGDDVVVIDFHCGVVVGELSRDHFDSGTAEALTVAAGEVAAAGWSWVPRTRVRAA